MTRKHFQLIVLEKQNNENTEKLEKILLDQ